MNEAQWLAKISSEHPDAPALALGEEVVKNFAELADDVAKLAHSLRELDLKTGDRIAIFASNAPSYITALYSIWWAGLVAVPINAKLHHDEVGYIFNHAGIKLAFFNDATQETIEKAASQCEHEVKCINLNDIEGMMKTPAEMHPSKHDDLAWLFYTSGTTGRPKGAMLTFKNLDEMTTQFLDCVAQIDNQDAIIHAAPLSHGSGLYTLPHLRNGACQVIPESGGFEVEELTDLFDKWSGITMFAAPTMVNRLVRSDANLTKTQLNNLKVIVYGGAPMYAEDAERALNRLGPKLAQIYGQGESPMTITYLSRDQIANIESDQWREKLSSVGVAFPKVEVAVKTDDGQIKHHNASGEVIVRGEIVMKGYWQHPEATAKTIQDGWLHTGDIGRLSEDGYLTLLDRSKDLIISGGSNIYPREVEEILLTHPDVEDVSVIGRQDADWGEIVVAYFVGTASAQELDKLCLDRIARFKRPKDYVAVKSLPKSHYGKVLKSALRETDLKR